MAVKVPAASGWMPFAPSVAGGGDAKRAYAESVRRVVDAQSKAGLEGAETALRALLRDKSKWPNEARTGIAASLAVLVDLLHQGWEFQVNRGLVSARRGEDPDPDSTRRVRRQQLALRRDEQLREPATREFVQRMERTQLTPKGRCSIFNLMCDGEVLAGRIAAVSAGNSSELVRPYLEVCKTGLICSETGLPLQDIWRYFRHTWANAYESVPGRSIQVLVRDASQPWHPVMGVIALGSAAIKVRCRDEYIGWEPDSVVGAIQKECPDKWAEWIVRFLEEKFAEVYRTDLVEDGLLPGGGFGTCTPQHAAALISESERSREVHQSNVDKSEFVRGGSADVVSDEDWEIQARTSLFRSKRCKRFADLISAAADLSYAGGQQGIRARLLNLHEDRAASRAIATLASMARAESIGTEIADLIVCGSVPPYSEILGGKLVAMLAASPDMVQCYRERYAGFPSIIASSMAGRAVVRPANLAFIGTTSLYGLRPSQYDRAGYPATASGARPGDSICYRYLARTEGFGSSQISARTFEHLERYMRQTEGRKSRANNVFGEGANPRFRALRESLDRLGLPSVEILRHGQAKCVYGVRLASNVRDYLLKLDREPTYLFNPESGSAAGQIASHWLRRWVLPRIADRDLVGRVLAHSTALPVRHGARVALPEDDLDQPLLFADLKR